MIENNSICYEDYFNIKEGTDTEQDAVILYPKLCLCFYALKTTGKSKGKSSEKMQQIRWIYNLWFIYNISLQLTPLHSFELTNWVKQFSIYEEKQDL